MNVTVHTSQTILICPAAAAGMHPQCGNVLASTLLFLKQDYDVADLRNFRAYGLRAQAYAPRLEPGDSRHVPITHPSDMRASSYLNRPHAVTS